jgi:hydrogenase maturation protease
VARPLIIAYGNSLRGDDGVAFAVVDLLVQRSRVPFDIIRAQQLDLVFADQISQSDLVVFVDASVVGTPGAVDMTWILPDEDTVARTHECLPSALLAYTEAVSGRVPRAALVTIVGSSFGFSESLSPAATSGIPLAVDMIVALMESRPSSATA